MTIQVDCPNCRRKLFLSSQELRRDMILSCAYCNNDIAVSGPFLTEVFWAANNLATCSR